MAETLKPGDRVTIKAGESHEGEQGVITDEVIKTTGQYIVNLDNCQHGTERTAIMLQDYPQAGQGGAGKGRPTTFTEELGAEICGMIAEGMSLRKICKQENMPAISTVMRWLTDDDKTDFQEQYAHAREAAADALADDIQDIADGVLKKEYDPHSARVAMDGKKWIASKLKPKKYGDKLDLSGETTVNHKFKDMDDDALDAAIANATGQN